MSTKQFKNKIAVTGDRVLLDAFVKKLDELGHTPSGGYGTAPVGKVRTWLEVNLDSQGIYLDSYSNNHGFTPYTLPQQWDEAIKAASEEVEVIPEYVKAINDAFPIDTGDICKVDSSGSISSPKYKTGQIQYIWYPESTYFIPATKEEYDAYQESLKPKFEVGKWYYTYDGSVTRLFKFVRIEKEGDYNRIHVSNEFSGSNSYKETNSYANESFEKNARLATKEEIETALIAEAKKRGFNDHAKCTGVRNIAPDTVYADTGTRITYAVSKSNATASTSFNYNIETDTLYNWGRGLVVLYEQGKWAEIISSHPDIKIGEHTVAFDTQSISIGCNKHKYTSIKQLYDSICLFNDQAKNLKSNNYLIEGINVGSNPVELNDLKQIVDYYEGL